MHFSTTDIHFYQNFKIYRGKIFPEPLKISQKKISLLQKLELLQYFIPIFQDYTEKWTVTCNVQCSPLLSSLYQSKFEMSTPAFTQGQSLFVKLIMALLIESCSR